MSEVDSSPVPVRPELNRNALLLALANEDRWAVVLMLADGRRMSVSQIAGALGRKFDGTSKTLLVLCDAGVIARYRGEDARNILYQIPAAFRTTPGVLDFGFCRFTLA
jgi:DNA-binding MarR family transcriptional regulator